MALVCAVLGGRCRGPDGATKPHMTFKDYQVDGFFDERVTENGKPRPAARLLVRDIESLPPGELHVRQQAAERALMEAGITFNVYSDSQGVEKTLPFDLIPRILPGSEWDRLEKGLQKIQQMLEKITTPATGTTPGLPGEGSAPAPADPLQKALKENQDLRDRLQRMEQMLLDLQKKVGERK